MSDNIVPLHDRPQRGACLIISEDTHAPGRLRDLSATGAFVETTSRPGYDCKVALVHPVVGAIIADVSAHARDGIALSFKPTEESAAFVYAATADDLTADVAAAAN
ncbi:MAG: hypothetical protein AAF205_13995 [Pseudomonadota bacterium]